MMLPSVNRVTLFSDFKHDERVNDHMSVVHGCDRQMGALSTTDWFYMKLSVTRCI